MNIVIPMAGSGSRFFDFGFEKPKSLIEVQGKPMIQKVIENINIDANYVYIVQKCHVEKFSLDLLLNHLTPKCKIVELNALTEGPACSAYLSKNYINTEDKLIVTNCDQIIDDWDPNSFFKFTEKYKLDALLGCFISKNKHNSYVKIDPQNLVTEVKEKQVISDIATNGLHFWKKAEYFYSSVDAMIANKDKSKNEYYIAPSFNYLIRSNHKVGIYLFNEHYPIGTPQDLEKYLRIHSSENNTTFKL